MKSTNRDNVLEMQWYYERRMQYYDETRPLDWTTPELCGYVMQELRGRSVLEVACGTGFWTSCLAQTANRLVAVDASPSALAIAAKKTYRVPVAFVQSDAFDAQTFPAGHFDACFFGDWWSHVPLSWQHSFLRFLHSRLATPARVVIVDHLPWPTKAEESHDDEGNRLERRHLRDGSSARVIKNFPSPKQLEGVFACYATEYEYAEYRGCGVKASGRWSVAYTVAGERENQALPSNDETMGRQGLLIED